MNTDKALHFAAMAEAYLIDCESERDVRYACKYLMAAYYECVGIVLEEANRKLDEEGAA